MLFPLRELEGLCKRSLVGCATALAANEVRCRKSFKIEPCSVCWMLHAFRQKHWPCCPKTPIVSTVPRWSPSAINQLTFLITSGAQKFRPQPNDRRTTIIEDTASCYIWRPRAPVARAPLLSSCTQVKSSVRKCSLLIASWRLFEGSAPKLLRIPD